MEDEAGLVISAEFIRGWEGKGDLCALELLEGIGGLGVGIECSVEDVGGGGFAPDVCAWLGREVEGFNSFDCCVARHGGCRKVGK